MKQKYLQITLIWIKRRTSTIRTETAWNMFFSITTSVRARNNEKQTLLISQHPQLVSITASETKWGRWETVRRWMRRPEKHEWMGIKRENWRAAASLCPSVSVCLCHHDRPPTAGNPKELHPPCCTQGLHPLTDRAKGCPVHSISQPAHWVPV